MLFQRYAGPEKLFALAKRQRQDFMEKWGAHHHIARRDRADVLAAVRCVRHAAAAAGSANVCQETNYQQALQNITGQLQEHTQVCPKSEK
jgi:hypothetical protein